MSNDGHELETPATKTGSNLEAPPLASAQTLGRYQILSVAGTGGMGRVYAAFDPKLDRRVALKVVHTSKDTHHQRAAREAKALARLSHPNVVAIHEVNESNDGLLIAMEYVQGQTLKAWMEANPPSKTSAWLSEALDLLLQAGRGLCAAHDAQLVHRDFKPSNVLVGDDGRVRVVDFGLARDVLDRSSITATSDGDSAEVSDSVTRTGTVVGTPAYMAPEQRVGNPPEARMDQYSFCVVAWEMLFAERPTDAKAARPEESQVPATLEKALRKGLSKKANNRFDTIENLLERLAAERDALGGKPPRTWWKWLAAAALLPLGYGAFELAQRAWTQHQVETCQSGVAAIDADWNSEVAAELSTTLAKTRSGSDPAYVERAVSKLDEYAVAWRDSFSNACTTSIQDKAWTPTQTEAVTWCLDEKRGEFGALATALQLGTDAAAESAVEAAYGLPQSSWCLEPASLPELPPEELRTQAAFADVRGALRTAGALHSTGQYEKSEQEAREALKAAEEIGWDPLIAEARLQVLASAAIISIDRQLVEDLARDAYIEALRSRSWNLAASAAIEVARVQRQHGKVDSALYWSNLGEAMLDLAGGTRPLQQAELARVRSRVLDFLGRPDDAMEAGTQAIDILQASLGADHPRTKMARRAVAEVLTGLGRFEEAVQILESAVESDRHSLGERHPSVGRSLSLLAANHRESGQLASAEDAALESLEISKHNRGPDSFDTSLAQRDLGLIYLAQRKWEEAESVFLEAQRIQSSLSGSPKVHLSVNQYLLKAQEAAGHLDAAWETSAKLVEVLDAGHGIDPINRSIAYVNVAKLARRQGKVEDALELHDRALALIVAKFGDAHEEVVHIQTNRAVTLLLARRFDEALLIQTDALALHGRIASERDIPSSWMHENLAKIHSGLGNFDKALAELQLSQEIRLEFVAPDTDLAKRVPKLIAGLCEKEKFAPACELHSREE